MVMKGFADGTEACVIEHIEVLGLQREMNSLRLQFEDAAEGQI